MVIIGDKKMKNRKERLAKIRELLNTHEISTQEELTQLVKDAGFPATQATMSRDIKYLHLVKVTRNGRAIYRSPIPSDVEMTQKQRTLLRETVVSVDYSINIAVIKTLAGMASTAAAVIDGLGSSEILGTIAGDDTILVVVRDEDTAVVLVRQFKELLGSKFND